MTRLEGKYKLSQNRSHSDQNNVVHELLQSTESTVHTIGAAIKQNLETGEMTG
ncbi:hypothetical protein [Nostoc sp.]|uniref:hypothetical protein n=1 Tax=Nostoc sp. TaxID=1180 RepID=UPI002FFCF9D5